MDAHGCSFCPLTLEQIITMGPHSSLFCLFLLGQTPVAHITYAVHVLVSVGTEQLVSKQSCAGICKYCSDAFGYVSLCCVRSLKEMLDFYVRHFGLI